MKSAPEIDFCWSQTKSWFANILLMWKNNTNCPLKIEIDRKRERLLFLDYQKLSKKGHRKHPTKILFSCYSSQHLRFYRSSLGDHCHVLMWEKFETIEKNSMRICADISNFVHSNRMIHSILIINSHDRNLLLQYNMSDLNRSFEIVPGTRIVNRPHLNFKNNRTRWIIVSTRGH